MAVAVAATGRLIGYARVSTAEQNPDMQIAALKRAGVAEQDIYVEHASGVAAKRPQLTAALKALRRGDTLVFWKLDRVARSLLNLLKITTDLEKRNVGIRSLTEGIDTTTPGGKLILHVMGALAEFERALIAERTREGIRRRKERGQRFGPAMVLSVADIAKAKDMLEKGADATEVAKHFKVSRQTVYRRVVWDR